MNQLNEYMMSDSVIEPTGLMNSPCSTSGQKLLMESEAAPNQSMMDEESVFIDDMDESILATNRSVSPRSPKRNRKVVNEKLRIVNDLG